MPCIRGNYTTEKEKPRFSTRTWLPSNYAQRREEGGWLERGRCYDQGKPGRRGIDFRVGHDVHGRFRMQLGAKTTGDFVRAALHNATNVTDINDGDPRLDAIL